MIADCEYTWFQVSIGDPNPAQPCLSRTVEIQPTSLDYGLIYARKNSTIGDLVSRGIGLSGILLSGNLLSGNLFIGEFVIGDLAYRGICYRGIGLSGSLLSGILFIGELLSGNLLSGIWLSGLCRAPHASIV